MKKGIYRFAVDCGRMGDIESIFVADHKAIEDSIGREVYFGEVLGKHSEIVFDLEIDHFELVTEEPGIVRMFEEFDLSCGMNPFDYLREEEKEEDDE